MVNRRNFLRISSFAALAAGTGNPAYGSAQQALLKLTQKTPLGIYPPAGDSDLKDLARRALDAAVRAGAKYADVRLTVTRQQGFYYGNPPIDSERIAVGVRALSSSAWGFTAGVNWTSDAMERLGRDAALQAKGNEWRHAPPIELGEPPEAAAGSWKMPVERDPFAVAVEEKLDYIRSAEAYARTFRNASARSVIVFERQERTFASTDGAFCSQTVYNSLGNRSFFTVSAVDRVAQRSGGRTAEFIGPVGRGYEAFEELKLLDQIPEMYEEAQQIIKAVPVAPSRYEVVLDGYAMASLLNETVGKSLEIDRALGYEANADGTSYLSPVEDMLGSKLGSSLLSVMADRSSVGGAATVRWDDEGIAPHQFALIKDGAIVDYITGREHSRVLEQWYRSRQTPIQSQGCMASGNGTNIPLIHTPNLVMRAGNNDLTFEDLVKSIDDGIAIMGGQVLVDQQQLNGQGIPGMMYRIRRGKIADVIMNGAYLFKSTELWKSLVNVGGERSGVWKGFTSVKGQPQQTTVHSVRGVAAHFKDMRVIAIAAEGTSSYERGANGILL